MQFWLVGSCFGVWADGQSTDRPVCSLDLFLLLFSFCGIGILLLIHVFQALFLLSSIRFFFVFGFFLGFLVGGILTSLYLVGLLPGDSPS